MLRASHCSWQSGDKSSFPSVREISPRGGGGVFEKSMLHVPLQLVLEAARVSGLEAWPGLSLS